MNKINNAFSSIEQVAGQYLHRGKSSSAPRGEAPSFEELLQRTREGSDIKFSKHAAQRLDDRQISLTDEQSTRLSDGVQRAGEKGIQESLVIMDSLAFIVNVPSRTVVTAMEQTQAQEHIFTNIDGAVIV